MPRPQLTPEAPWKRQFKRWLRPTHLPGVWQLQSGGHLVRGRVKDPTTGQQREIRRVLPSMTAAEAYLWLTQERDRVRTGLARVQPPKEHFADYAISVLERKTGPGGRVRSRASRARWRNTLVHLIGGTAGPRSGMFVDGFGELYVDRITCAHVDSWRRGIATLIEAGDYAPTTANGWMSILSLIFKAARRDFGLLTIPTDGLERFDLSEHIVYSEEQPNSLRPAQVGPFLKKLHELHPRHFAMTFLGFATGLRPSSLRPLRRKGSEPDVRWDEHRLLVRRSHVGGDEVMLTTKQRRRYSIQLPEEAIDVLRWHVDTQLDTDEQRHSDLLFPSTTGGFRAPCVLNKPFAEVAEEMNLGFRFTQRGMRRTFNDLARQAQILDVITRSISGHCTTQMQHHYSSVQPEEQRESIARVLGLLGRSSRMRSPTQNAPRHAIDSRDAAREHGLIWRPLPQ